MGISHQQALDCFASDDLIGVGMEADAVRRSLHPEGVVTYTLDRTLCLTSATLFEQAAEALDLGATGLTLRAATPSTLPLPALESLLTGLRTRCPSLWLHGLSATAIGALAAQTGLAVPEILTRLQAAGLHSLAGDDAEILGGTNTAGGTSAATDWLAVHRAAHRLGLPSTATMRFGSGETLEQRVRHLEALSALQRETGGLLSFRPLAAPLSMQEEPTAVEYLKTLAIARMVLDSIPHIEADWFSQGLKLLQVALRFGANDVGSTFPGETLANPGGTREEDLRRVIREAGFRPAQRDTPYRTLFLS